MTFGQIVEDREEAAYKKGQNEAKMEDALAMKKEGIAVELVARVTGLSIEEIQKLQ